MTNKEISSDLDAYFNKATKWNNEIKALRTILLESGLAEVKKWGKPCYTFMGNNIVIIQDFKEYCALLFFKGMLLKDPHKILIKTGANTRVSRQIRFNDVAHIKAIYMHVRDCIKEAIEIEKSGIIVPKEEKKDLVLIPELQSKLKKHAALKKAFIALTPGRQRGYNMYFSSAKQSSTRETRIEKGIPLIMAGKGFNEK